MEVRYLLPASLEFLDAVEFYESKAPGLGEEYIEEVEYALELLSSHPQLGVPHLEGTRRVLLGRFPFDLVYLIESDTIVVVAVAHHRRQPGYWRDRT